MSKFDSYNSLRAASTSALYDTDLKDSGVLTASAVALLWHVQVKRYLFADALFLTMRSMHLWYALAGYDVLPNAVANNSSVVHFAS